MYIRYRYYWYMRMYVCVLYIVKFFRYIPKPNRILPAIIAIVGIIVRSASNPRTMGVDIHRHSAMAQDLRLFYPHLPHDTIYYIVSPCIYIYLCANRSV